MIVSGIQQANERITISKFLKKRCSKIKKVYSLEESIELVKNYIGLDFTTKDPINTNILKNKIYQRRILGEEKTSLTFEEAYALGTYLVGLGRNVLPRKLTLNEKRMYNSRCLAIAVGLQTAGLTPLEIAGLSTAIMDHDILNYVCPKADNVLDNCGMGGDKILTPNVSTISLLTIANYKGIKTSKHGSPGNTDSAGSSDFFSYLLKKRDKKKIIEKKFFDNGFPTKISPEKVAELIDNYGFFYTEAIDLKYKTIHLQTHFLGAVAHINDILGPITSPITPEKIKRKVIGVNHLVSPTKVAEAYRIMNKKGSTNIEKAYFIRGLGKFGMDEFSPFPDGTEVTILNKNKIETINVFPEDFGIKPVKPVVEDVFKGRYIIKDISPHPLKNESGALIKSRISEQLLNNDIKGSMRDLIKINMSPLLVIENKVKNFKDGADLAEILLNEKQGIKTINNLVSELIIK